MPVLSDEARAKVNLTLLVNGRRADGYHDLESVVAFADCADRLTLTPGPGLDLKMLGPLAAACGDTSDNLVLKAARLLAERVPDMKAGSFSLDKVLPVAAGIGGGSADAAAALRALSRLWYATPPLDVLEAIAVQLGADVPVCLDGRTAFISGIGERRETGPALPEAGLVLVNPRIPLATPAVFGKRSGPFSQPNRFATPPRDAVALAEQLRARRNDLTEAARAIVPAIGEVLDAIAASPGCLLDRMSGSGATCFGVYPTADIAERAASWLAARKPGWWVLATALAGPE
jgi:4-diphosphocytidyl-2-C-methyl-D-erythritol kinase